MPLESHQVDNGLQRPNKQVRRHAYQGQACGGAADEEARLLFRILPAEDSAGIVELKVGHSLEHADRTLQGVQNLYDRASLTSRILAFYLAHVLKSVQCLQAQVWTGCTTSVQRLLM